MLTENMTHVPFKTVVYPQLKAALQDSGVSPLCVWRWTTGKNEFSIGVIKAILAVTGLTFEEAFGECEGRR